eukprot:COSAG01_NODE_1668_length_9563_cov_23.675613_5_plen_122_part_00
MGGGDMQRLPEGLQRTLCSSIRTADVLMLSPERCAISDFETDLLELRCVRAPLRPLHDTGGGGGRRPFGGWNLPASHPAPARHLREAEAAAAAAAAGGETRRKLLVNEPPWSQFTSDCRRF